MQLASRCRSATSRAGTTEVVRSVNRCYPAAAVSALLRAFVPIEHFVRRSPYLRQARGIEDRESGNLVSTAFNRLRRAVSCLTAAALLLAQVPTARAASAMTRAEYEACQARDEHGFRAAIEAADAPGAGDRPRQRRLQGPGRRRMAARQHRRHHRPRGRPGHRRGARGIELVQAVVDTGLAREGAGAGHHGRRAGLSFRRHEEGHRGDGDGRRQGDRQAHRARHHRHGRLRRRNACRPSSAAATAATVARIVADGAGKEYSIDPIKGGAQVSTGQVLVEGSEGIAGTVVLVVRRQLSNMATRIGQRIVGSILSRLVSVVAGGVGLVLIAKDIWDFRHGVLPIIAERDEVEGHQGQGARGAGQVHRRADQRQPQGDLRQDRRARGGDLARVPPCPRQGGRAGRSPGRLQALPRDRQGRRHAAARRDRCARAGQRGRGRRAQAAGRWHACIAR